MISYHLTELFLMLFTNLRVKINFTGDYFSHIYNFLSNQNFKYQPIAKILDCNLFIYEPETVPNNKLYYDIVKSNFKGEVYLIGQALENGDLSNDIESGYFVGKNI